MMIEAAHRKRPSSTLTSDAGEGDGCNTGDVVTAPAAKKRKQLKLSKQQRQKARLESVKTGAPVWVVLSETIVAVVTSDQVFYFDTRTASRSPGFSGGALVQCGVLSALAAVSKAA